MFISLSVHERKAEIVTKKGSAFCFRSMSQALLYQVIEGGYELQFIALSVQENVSVRPRSWL